MSVDWATSPEFWDLICVFCEHEFWYHGRYYDIGSCGEYVDNGDLCGCNYLVDEYE